MPEILDYSKYMILYRAVPIQLQVRVHSIHYTCTYTQYIIMFIPSYSIHVYQVTVECGFTHVDPSPKDHNTRVYQAIPHEATQVRDETVLLECIKYASKAAVYAQIPQYSVDQKSTSCNHTRLREVNYYMSVSIYILTVPKSYTIWSCVLFTFF